MNYILNDVLGGDLIPVFLGGTSEAKTCAHKLYRKYGVITHVFCKKSPLLQGFSLCCRFHTVNETEDDRLLYDALNDFAKQFDNADRILYLVPFSKEAEGFLLRYRSVLEARFVITPKAEMERTFFPTDFEEGHRI